MADYDPFKQIDALLLGFIDNGLPLDAEISGMRGSNSRVGAEVYLRKFVPTL